MKEKITNRSLGRNFDFERSRKNPGSLRVHEDYPEAEGDVRYNKETRIF